MRNYSAGVKFIPSMDIGGLDVRADDRALRFDFAQPVPDAQQAWIELV